MNETAPTKWASFAQLGEEKVRQNLANRVYSGRNAELARQWLAHQADVRAEGVVALSAASTEEQIRLDRSANRIAMVAAIAAIVAAITATIGAIISILVYLQK